MKYILALAILTATCNNLQAQTSGNIVPDTLTLSRSDNDGVIFGVKGGTDTATKKTRKSIWVGSGGIHYENGTKDSTNNKFSIQFGMLDLGVNVLQDNTDYTGAEVRNYMRIDPTFRGSDLFSLRTSK